MKKIIIKEDQDCEMMSITTSEGECLFYGNYWDFNRTGDSFKSLFEKLGFDVKLTETEYSNW